MNSNKKTINVACIANYPSVVSLRYLRKNQGDPLFGSFFKPMFYDFFDVRGSVVALNSSPKDLMTLQGIKEARKQFILALKSIYEYNKENLSVVLLAASLKRLFGHNLEEKIDEYGNGYKNGNTLSQMFPNILFTNGDNGTSAIFAKEIDFILSKANVKKGCGKVLIFGAGILGIKTVKYLLQTGLESSQLFIVSSLSNEIKDIAFKNNIEIISSIEEMETECDVIISCTHKNPISASQINLLNCKYVLDVAVPPGFPEDEYLKCRDVYRQDAGNAYSKNLIYKFDQQWIDLGGEHEMYGCFAEATVISKYIKDNGPYFEGKNIFNLNWFDVNDTNAAIIEKLFLKYDFSRNPQPLCFGHQV